MPLVQLPILYCAHCGHKLDGASARTANYVPKENDVTMCFYCGGVMRFTADGSVRVLTAEEKPLVMANIGVRRALAALLLTRAIAGLARTPPRV